MHADSQDWRFKRIWTRESQCGVVGKKRIKGAEPGDKMQMTVAKLYRVTRKKLHPLDLQHRPGLIRTLRGPT